MSESDWLRWSRQLQAIAQTGLAYTDSPLDRERSDAAWFAEADLLVDLAHRLCRIFAHARDPALPTDFA